MTRKWHYIDNMKKTKGPFTLEILASMYKKNLINDGTYVWNGSSVKDWSPIGKLPDLKSQLSDAEEPPMGLQSMNTIVLPQGHQGANMGGGKPKRANSRQLNIVYAAPEQAAGGHYRSGSVQVEHMADEQMIRKKHRLDSDKKKLKKKHKKLKREKKRMEEAQKAAQSTEQDLRNQQAQTERMKHEAMKMKEDSTRQLKREQAELERSKKKVDEERNRLKQARAKLEQEKQQLEDERDDINEGRDAVEEEKRKVQQVLSTRINELKTRFRKLEDELRDREDEVEAQANELEREREAIDRQQMDLEDQKAELKRKLQQTERTDRRGSSGGDDNGRVQALSGQLLEMGDKLSTAKAEVRTLKGDISRQEFELKKANQEKEASIRRARDDQEEIRRKARMDLEELKGKMQRDETAWNEEKRRLKDQNADIQAELRNFKAQHDTDERRWKDTNDRISQERNTLQQQFQAASMQSQQLQAQNQQMQMQGAIQQQQAHQQQGSAELPAMPEEWDEGPETDPVRDAWGEGSMVQIYSMSGNGWFDGIVKEVMPDQVTLIVEYKMPDGSWNAKELNRYDEWMRPDPEEHKEPDQQAALNSRKSIFLGKKGGKSPSAMLATIADMSSSEDDDDEDNNMSMEDLMAQIVTNRQELKTKANKLEAEKNMLG